MHSPQYGSQSTPFTHATHVSAISHVPDTSRDSHELINRRIGVNANRNNGDRLMTIKADPVGGKDMQRKSGRPRVVYACVRSLHHIIPSTFFTLRYDRYECQNTILFRCYLRVIIIVLHAFRSDCLGADQNPESHVSRQQIEKNILDFNKYLFE